VLDTATSAQSNDGSSAVGVIASHTEASDTTISRVRELASAGFVAADIARAISDINISAVRAIATQHAIRLTVSAHTRCLCCRRQFFSHDLTHNRLCASCH
jgi:hypothetical protein